MVAASRRARENRRAARVQRAQGVSEDASTMEFDIPNQEDDGRRNTSSEDEGADPGQSQLTTINPDVANLVNHATQIIGTSDADGTSLALAAVTAHNPADALNLLAASSAIANIRNDTANHNASEAKILANLAESGLRDSDVTYDKRFKRYDDELEERATVEELNKKATLEELQQLKGRVALLEGLLCRVLSMMQNGNVDATEVGQMLRHLGI
ncbi:hypothetical protein J7T55_010052 [Diaporthe amygdali]|uniref:uncharacterized protein n=1 Tax=Phomopsis amygdali TaxID=1214568 RepID=UPI0022FF3ADF|nr:uncharacterized protein J7T55_010052 [Diaporthe amygdali]KAJ0113808.1 hypothetical protein J7T55_010052 [Diaporthe amygdali]